MRATVKVNTGGRVVIPKTVREKLDLEHEDVVEIEVSPTGGSD